MTYPDTALSPWNHQKEAMKFLLSREGAGLFADMGTGKTKVAIDRIRGRGYSKTLVICPRKAIRVWNNEFESHQPGHFQISCSKEGNADDQGQEHLKTLKESQRNKHKPYVLISNYAMLNTVLTKLFKWVDWDHIILDESHRIKNQEGKYSRTLFQIGKDVPDKLCLTGTPMDKPEDIFAQFRFANRSVFGTSWYDFRNEFCVVKKVYGRKQIVDYKNQDKLHTLINKHSFRVSDDVLDLPKVVFKDYYCAMPPTLKDNYKEMEETVANMKNVSKEISQNNMMRLRRLATGFEKNQFRYNHKFDLFEDTLKEIPEGDPLVVFSYFHREMDQIEEILKNHGYQVGEISGRRDDIEPWEQGKITALIVQMQAGSEAINLTRSSHGIFFSPTYSFITYKQSLKRLHRPGQTRTVKLFFLLVEDSIEEDMRQCVNKKTNLIKPLFDK